MSDSKGSHYLEDYSIYPVKGAVTINGRNNSYALEIEYSASDTNLDIYNKVADQLAPGTRFILVCESKVVPISENHIFALHGPQFLDPFDLVILKPELQNGFVRSLGGAPHRRRATRRRTTRRRTTRRRTTRRRTTRRR